MPDQARRTPARPRGAAARGPAVAPATAAGASAEVIDLDRYVPAFLTWIANKLSRGASAHYLQTFDVGIETWRCLVLLAIHGRITAQQVTQIIGMDKASVSRCFKHMAERGFITLGLDADDGRLRIATLTPTGRAMHDQIKGMALAREQAFLAVLNPAEQDTLIALLHRLHENLPEVEKATDRYAERHFPQRARRRRAAPSQDRKDSES